jgi:hypothetical protein
MLNYGYSLLEAECLRDVNSVGLDGSRRVFAVQEKFDFSSFSNKRKCFNHEYS